MAKAKILTKDTQKLSDLPKGRRPEEFADDSSMVGLLERSIDELPKSDKRRKELRRQLKMARVAEALIETETEDADLDS